MQNKYLNSSFGAFCFLFVLSVFSCARQGSPEGGPKDVDPPVFIRSNPDTLSLNVPQDLDKIVIDFDEFVVLKDQNQILISPTLEKKPTFRPASTAQKKVEVSLKDSLKDNTTYQIFFGNAIQDNNEGNALKNFRYIFSTGSALDTLEIKGSLKSVAPLDLTKTIVGLYQQKEDTFSDSIFIEKSPDYLTYADSLGNYKLDYLRAGKYKIITFSDSIENQKYDIGKEYIGFIEKPFRLDSTTSISSINLFQETQEYSLRSAKLENYGMLAFKFTGSPDSVSISTIPYELIDARVVNFDRNKDSLQLWFDPEKQKFKDEKNPSLKVIVNYKDRIDTTKIVYTRYKKPELVLQLDKFDGSILSEVQLSANIPLDSIDADLFTVFSKKDTLRPEVQIKNENQLILDFEKDWDEVYQIALDSAAVKDVFGNVSDSLGFNTKTAPKQNYGKLAVEIEGKWGSGTTLEIREKDKNTLYKSVKLKDQNKWTFDNMPPAIYQLRLKLDDNDNGIWESGSLLDRRQPERIINPKKDIEIRPLWEVVERIEVR